MREVLFRGFHTDKYGKETVTINGVKIRGRWFYGYYVEATQHWHQYGIHKSWIVTGALQNGGFFNVMGRCAVISETVGQFTGLTDKNEKKIFAGDIVMINGLKCVVVYDEVCAQYKVSAPNKPYYFTMLSSMEVIGNVYSTPELLGGNE